MTKLSGDGQHCARVTLVKENKTCEFLLGKTKQSKLRNHNHNSTPPAHPLQKKSAIKQTKKKTLQNFYQTNNNSNEQQEKSRFYFEMVDIIKYRHTHTHMAVWYLINKLKQWQTMF